MARLFSAAMMREKNAIASSHVITMLFQLDIAGGPAPLRYANYDQPIIFHGFTFDPMAADVDALEDATAASLQQIQLTIQTVDQQFISLLENYWAPVIDPNWQVSIWQVDAQQVNETPFGVASVYTTLSITTDYVSASVILQAEGLTLTELVPKRRYTTLGGFPNLTHR